MSPYWAAHLVNVSSGAGPASGMLPTRKCGFGPEGRSISVPSVYSWNHRIFPTVALTSDATIQRESTGRLAFPGRRRRRRLRLVVAAKSCLYPLHDFWEFVRMLVGIGE